MSTQRTINRQLIVHNDLALGAGAVSQDNGTTTAEQLIELAFIFRTADEIRALNTTRYQRVFLHTEGERIEYWFSATSVAVDDGWDVLAPSPAVATGRWLRTGATPKIIRTDTTSLEDISNAINTSALKEEGQQVYNTTTNKPLWAAGNADGDIWRDATGSTAHTPV